MRFILNNKTVETRLPSGMVLVDFLREEKRLKGTKIGCREGDCGACTTLVGELIEGEMQYRSITSCITPLGNMAGKHVVTVEGINMDELSPVQKAMVEQGGTQCGFCTVGFVMSLTGYIMSEDHPLPKAAVSAIDGNICRCTGYKPIERAAADIALLMVDKPYTDRIDWLVDNGYLPSYFKEIPARMEEIASKVPVGDGPVIGGGTDLYVQRPDDFVENDVIHANQLPIKGIFIENEILKIGAGNTVSELMESAEMQLHFPFLYPHLKLVSSTPIRNISTLAGNFVNASPIGDMTAFFIALNSSIVLTNGEKNRTILLKDFYKGYKQIDKAENEYISEISFPIPSETARFNLEKVSKRIYLDIASVNTAMLMDVQDGKVQSVSISAGGVGPTPMRLNNTCDFLLGKELNIETVANALEIIQEEIAPISDVRGTEAYKRLLLKQLVTAHFHTMYPEVMKEEVDA